MAQENILLTDARDETPNTSMATDTPNIKEGDGSSGNKRAASESLEQNVTKVAKLTKAKDNDIESEAEVKKEPDPRHEEIAKLKDIVQKQRARIAELKGELEDVKDELDEETCRRHELEARETKRIEKEKVVETDMHATMKLATKNLRAKLNADSEQKAKDLKEDYKEKLANGIDKNDNKWVRKYNELQNKYEKLKADHKKELKDLKEKNKEVVKSYQPEHSQAMRDKAKELRAKDKIIADLEKSMEDMDALVMEKEKLANDLEKEKTRVKGLRQALNTVEADRADMEGAYNHKLKHEAARWKIQNDIAEDVKAKLMVQQRSNFALRQEASVKNNQLQTLQHQLQARQLQIQQLQVQQRQARQFQAAQQQHQISTADGAVQSHMSTTDASAQAQYQQNQWDA